jgi:isocitrate dehydrogenase
LKLNIPLDGTKIGHDGEKLIVPDNPIIPYIIGDGIGIDVTPVMKRVLDYAVNKAYGNSREIKWLELYAVLILKIYMALFFLKRLLKR